MDRLGESKSQVSTFLAFTSRIAFRATFYTDSIRTGRCVKINLTIGGDGLAENVFIQANEERKLRETFSALFDANVLAVKLVFMGLRS